MQKITTCLWFDGNAAEAAAFYVSLFPNSSILETKYLPEGGPAPAGTVLTVLFALDGTEFLALNGGPQYQFTPATSVLINCDTQEEVDRLWAKLSDGGTEVQCGWVTDRFGFSWQVVPRVLPRLLAGPDRAASQRAFMAMMKMKKLDIAEMERAYRGE
jgi:predicted 3-demethylubiquinone-9 3-methyltransferase (glyoxalase superfamily)